MELFILIISRFLVVLLTYYAFRACKKKSAKSTADSSYISLKNLMFISYSGIIRGAISYGLVSRLDLDKISSGPL